MMMLCSQSRRFSVQICRERSHDTAQVVSAQGLHGLLDVTKTDAIVADVKFHLIIVEASEAVDVTIRDRV